MGFIDEPTPPSAPTPQPVPEPPTPPPAPSEVPVPMPDAPIPVPPAPSEPAGGDVMGGSLGVSFLPSGDDVAKDAPNLKKRALVLLLVLVIETIVLGGTYAFLALSGSSKTEEKLKIQEDIVSAVKRSDQVREQAIEAAVYAAQTSAVQAALNDHVRWSNFFKFLEARTKPTVKYLGLTGDADAGTASFDAKGSSFRDIAEQIVVFREDPLVSSVNTGGAAANIDKDGNLEGIALSIGLKVKKELWRGEYDALTASSTASASAATKVVECGTSAQSTDAAARCFAAKFAECATATVTASNNFGDGAYTVVGASGDGCIVSFTYAQKIDLTQFAGKTYQCAYDAKKDFWGQTGRALDGCTGSLIDALAPAPSAAPAPATPPEPATENVPADEAPVAASPAPAPAP